MYLDRIIRTNQVKQFELTLLPHQKATTPDGINKKQQLDLDSFRFIQRLYSNKKVRL